MHGTVGVNWKKSVSVQSTPGDSVLLRGSNAAEPTRDGENAIHVPDEASAAADIIEKYLSEPDRLREIGLRASRTIGRRWDEIIPTVYSDYLRINAEHTAQQSN